MSKTSRFRLFAGPNGSGKTTLINSIGQEYDLGIFINADLLEYELGEKGFLDLIGLLGKPSPSLTDWNSFIKEYQTKDSRSSQIDPNSIRIKDGILVWEGAMNSYVASIIAAFFRYHLLTYRKSFSFETVMSHPSKLDFISEAKSLGYKSYLYFICTDDPLINIQRVKNRTEMGGHTVAEDLIKKRYFRSLELLKDAFLLADRVFVIDSSNRSRNLIVEKNQSRVIVYSSIIPGWVDKYLISKLNLS